MKERIQKALATAGVASRREIERLIAEGRILVNGRPAEAGQKIGHEDHVRVDGKPVHLSRKAEAARVLIYKKRTGELVTRDDPEGRRTVFRKLPKLGSGRWIAVGRLDINTSGLLLFTNHGELARRLTHPSFEIPRTYAVRVLGTVDEAVIARWKAGVELEDGMARFERVDRGSLADLADEDGESGSANQWFHVSVREGRNRLVRRLIESQNLQVSRLIRLRYGPVELGRGNKSGTAREATPSELLALLDAVGLSPEEAGLEAPRRGRGTPARPAAATPAGARPAPRPRRSFADDDDDEGFESPRRNKPSYLRELAKPAGRRPASARAAPDDKRAARRDAPPARQSRDAPGDGARSARPARSAPAGARRDGSKPAAPRREGKPAAAGTPRRDGRPGAAPRAGAGGKRKPGPGSGPRRR